MAKRKEARALTPEETRQAMLRGIEDEAAVFLYDQAMMALEARGHADFMAALQLRDAAQWTVVISEMQRTMRALASSGQDAEKQIAAIIKNKQAAEDARRRILDALLLTPQKKRGRPPGAKPERPGDEDAPADDGWDSFDDAPQDGDDDP